MFVLAVAYAGNGFVSFLHMLDDRNGIKSVTNIFARANHIRTKKKRKNMFDAGKSHVQCSTFNSPLHESCVRIKSVSFFAVCLFHCPYADQEDDIALFLFAALYSTERKESNSTSYCASGPMNELHFAVEILECQRKIVFNLNSRPERKKTENEIIKVAIGAAIYAKSKKKNKSAHV